MVTINFFFLNTGIAIIYDKITFTNTIVCKPTIGFVLCHAWNNNDDVCNVCVPKLLFFFFFRLSLCCIVQWRWWWWGKARDSRAEIATCHARTSVNRLIKLFCTLFVYSISNNFCFFLFYLLFMRIKHLFVLLIKPIHFLFYSIVTSLQTNKNFMILSEETRKIIDDKWF